MKSERITRIKLESDGALKRVRKDGRTGARVLPRVDRRKLESAAAFTAEKDAPQLTKRELQGFMRAESKVEPAKVRKKLRYSQAAFAALFGLSVGTIRDWEQKRRTPQGPARVLLTVIAKNPKAVLEALRG